MSACANCARELRPEWRFCVYCGTPTGVTSARPEAVHAVLRPAIEPEPEPAAPPEAVPEPEPAPAPVADPEPAPVPVPVPVPEVALAPAPELVPVPAGAHAPTLEIAPAPAPVVLPTSLRTRSGSRSREPTTRPRVNPVAVIALVLGVFVSPLAALFGHIALVQIAASHERGRIPAIIAIVLGYASLAFIVELVIVYLINNG